MSVDKAKIINVIEVRSDTGITYFTLDGLKIGGFINDHIETDEHPVEREQPKPIKPPGAVAKNMSPKKAAIQKDRDDENLATKILGRRDNESED